MHSYAIRHLVHLRSETQWCDLLAVLIESDPRPLEDLLGLRLESENVRVRREVRAGGRDRLDLVIDDGERLAVVLEAKVLHTVDVGQLRRYETVPAPVRVVVQLAQFAVDLPENLGWQVVTWERLLEAFGRVPGWVGVTAMHWRAQLEQSVPHVHRCTIWNDLRDGDDFVLAMRARMSWVAHQVSVPSGVDHDLVSSAAGVSWVARLTARAVAPGYEVIAEAEERLPVRNFPKYVTSTSPPPRGPSIRLSLCQRNVATSVRFDWDHLLAMWPLMEASRDDWVTNRPNFRSNHDRANWKAMTDKGGPQFLGIGFGDAQARKYGSCMFGARFQLPPDVSLAEVAETLSETASLVKAMGEVERPVAGCEP